MSTVGTIIEITNEEMLNDSLRKKTFVLLEDGPFPSELQFELFNEKIALLENFKQGDRVSLKYRPRGFSRINEEGKISRWTSLRPYRITLFDNSNQVQQPNQTPEKSTNGE